MSRPVSSLWVSLFDSKRFRQFAKHGAGARLFRSPTYRKVILARDYVASSYGHARNPVLFRDVRIFCLFIGHNKSGTSLVGSLLDAHPNVILADETDVLEYVSAGFTRDQICHILLRHSRREALKGRVTARRLTAYSYRVPDQWQGRYSRLQVIGDSTSGSSTERFARDPGLLRRLENVMAGVGVKFIQVIRNPYDPITVSMVRGKQSFENAAAKYFGRCETLVTLRKHLTDQNLLAVRYEDFVRNPTERLTKVCNFLGLEASEEYLKACASIVYKEPDRSRRMVQWNSTWINLVTQKTEQFDFLQGYSFEN